MPGSSGMTAPPQRPAVAFKPGDRDLVGAYRRAVERANRATDREMDEAIGGCPPAPPPVAADDGLREIDAWIEALPKANEAWADKLPARLSGPHEWGYRDPADGKFIVDDVPYEAAAAIATHLAENEALKAEVARLTSELKESYTDENGTVWTRPTAWAYYMSQLRKQAAESRATRAEAATASAVEALEPLAKWATELDAEFADHADYVIAGGVGAAVVTFGDLRRASSTLAAIKGETT